MSQEFTIGRDDVQKADILLSGSHISGLHARIGVDSTGRLWVQDLKSTNGTEVIFGNASRRVGTQQREYVQRGEILSFGGVQYSVDQLFALLPSRPPVQPDTSSVVMVRCRYCGTPTPAGSPCTKCKR